MKKQDIGQIDRPLKVLVVDDSPMMCKAIEQILQEDEGIDSITKVLNGKEALRELSSKRYDVCTLDVHMPGMNGLTVLKNIMVKFPLPTLMVSAFTSEGSKVTFEALRYGAVDFFKKPTRDSDNALKEQGERLRKSLRRASCVQVKAARYLRVRPKATFSPSEQDKKAFNSIIVIYGSTGSYSSILSIIPQLNESLNSPIIISIDYSEENLSAFIDYLRAYCLFPLKIAKDTQRLMPKTIYFLPEGYAAHFDRSEGNWEMICKKRPIETQEEGAIDLTLLSASESFGDKALAIFVSGDSSFGLTGTKELLRSKGKVLVQAPTRCLAPLTPITIQEEFEAESLEPHELSQKISKWAI